MSFSVKSAGGAKYQPVDAPLEVLKKPAKPSWFARTFCCCCLPEEIPEVVVEIVTKTPREVEKAAALDNCQALDWKLRQMNLENLQAGRAGKECPHTEADLAAALKAKNEARAKFLQGKF